MSHINNQFSAITMGTISYKQDAKKQSEHHKLDNRGDTLRVWPQERKG